MASETPFEFKEVSVEDIVAKAMVELQSALAGKHYEVLAEKKSAILEVVRKRAETNVKLSSKLVQLVTNKAGPAELEAVMSKTLPFEEIQLIKSTFLFETYQVEVYKCSIPGPKSFVSFSREGEEIFPDIALDSPDAIIGASSSQYASIVIEVCYLVLSVCGIVVSFTGEQMADITRIVEAIIQCVEFESAFTAFRRAWKIGDNWNRARAIFNFLRDMHAGGIFWDVINAILSTMSTWERVRAIAEISVTIVSAFISGGVLLIAQIALAVNSAVRLAQKFVNLDALNMVQVDHTD